MFVMTDNGHVRNVTFQDSTVQSNGIATLIGTQTHAVANVLLENLQMTIRPTKKLYELEIPDPIPNYAQHHFAPCNLYMRHVRDICIRGLTVHWQHNPQFEHSFCAITLRNGENVCIEGLDAKAYDSSGELPAVRVESSRNVTIQ